MPNPNRAARHAARMGMSTTASKMHPNCGPSLRTADPVAYWDLVATMNDYRAALCLAVGVPVEDIDRDGYNLSRPGGRQYMAHKRATYGARPDWRPDSSPSGGDLDARLGDRPLSP